MFHPGLALGVPSLPGGLLGHSDPLQELLISVAGLVTTMAAISRCCLVLQPGWPL